MLQVLPGGYFNLHKLLLQLQYNEVVKLKLSIF